MCGHILTQANTIDSEYLQKKTSLISKNSNVYSPAIKLLKITKTLRPMESTSLARKYLISLFSLLKCLQRIWTARDKILRLASSSRPMTWIKGKLETATSYVLLAQLQLNTLSYCPNSFYSKWILLAIMELNCLWTGSGKYWKPMICSFASLMVET